MTLDQEQQSEVTTSNTNTSMQTGTMDQQQDTTIGVACTLEAERPESPTDSDNSSVSSCSSDESEEYPSTYVYGMWLRTIVEEDEEEEEEDEDEDEEEEEGEEQKEEEWPLPNLTQAEHNNTDNISQNQERDQTLHALTRATLSPRSSPKYSPFPSILPTPTTSQESFISAPFKITDSRFRARAPDGPLNSHPLSAAERRECLGHANRHQAVRKGEWTKNHSICPRVEMETPLELPKYTCDKGEGWQPMDLLEFCGKAPTKKG